MVEGASQNAVRRVQNTRLAMTGTMNRPVAADMAQQRGAFKVNYAILVSRTQKARVE